MGNLKSPKRQIAYKVWISDLINSEYIKQEGWDPSYSKIGDKKVSRVNILSTVVGKFVSDDGNYGTLTLDDGSETIRVKAFGPDVYKISETKVGEIVRLIGKVKEYQDEIYLSPEVIREIDDPNWLIVRKLELKEPEIKEKTRNTSNKKEKPEEIKKEDEKETSEEDKEDETDANSDILGVIKKLDKGEGAEMKKVLEEVGLDEDEGKKFLFSLLKRGEIFEPKKGKLKVLD